MLTETTTREIVRHEASFTAPDVAPGVTYHRLTVRPTDPAQTRARLAIVHGYGDHAGRYLDAMTWLAIRGVACHAFDLRGHGRSSGRRAYLTRWDEYLDDLRAFVSLPDLRPAPSHSPLFVLGHSHGGLVVAVAGIRQQLATPAIAGCILSAPYLVNALHVPRVKRLAGRVADALCPWLRISSGVRPEMTSRDPDRIADSMRDPLLLRCATPRWFLTHQAAQAEALAGAPRFTLPLLVVQGDADPIAAPRGAAAFHAAARSADKTLITYPGFLHEPLRELGRERVYADVLEWIERHVEQPSPPATPAGQRSVDRMFE